MRTWVLLLLLFPTAACGGGTSDSGTIARGDGSPDSASAASCKIPPAFGDLGSMYGSGCEGYPCWSDDLPSAPDRTAIGTIELDIGRGVFADGLQTGTFDLQGDEVDAATCGACVWLNPPDAFEWYQVTSGTLVVTSHTLHFTGSLENATFVHTVWENSQRGSTTPAEDGCTSSIDHLDFDAPIYGE